jgi:large subunit ribosomal protein L24
VIRVMPTEDRALVQGVNLVKRHQKATGIGNPGGINEKEAPIHLSNLSLIDPKSGKPTARWLQAAGRWQEGPGGTRLRRGA